MTGHCRGIIGILVAVVVCAAVAAYWFLLGPIFKHRTEIKRMKALAERIRQYEPSDVERIIILLDHKVELDPGNDREDIVRLMSSLRRITVENRERSLGRHLPGILIVKLNRRIDGHAGFRIDGNFDPENAPIITRSMRSDDLSAIIYDIYERRGMKPRKE